MIYQKEIKHTVNIAVCDECKREVLLTVAEGTWQVVDEKHYCIDCFQTLVLQEENKV